MANLLDAALVRPSSKKAAEAKPAEAKPAEAKPAEAKPDATEIDEVVTLQDAIAVRLGEKKVRAPETPGDDPDIEKEIATVTANLSKSQRDAFAKKTYELRDANRKLKESEAFSTEKAALEAKIKELESKTAVVQPDEALKTRLAEYEAELSSVRLEKTATFRKEIAEPLAALEASAATIAKTADVEEAEVLAALRSTGEARDRKLGEILANMSELNKVRFVQVVQNMDALASKRETLLANAQQSLEGMKQSEAQAAAERESSVKAERSAAKPQAWTNIVSTVPELTVVEGNEEWNTALKVAQDFADRSYADFSVASQAEIMQRAGSFPLLAGTVAYLRDHVAALEKDLASYRSATPSVADGSRSTEPPPGTDNETFEQRIGRRLQAAGVK